jgi:hypothetical protein
VPELIRFLESYSFSLAENPSDCASYFVPSRQNGEKIDVWPVGKNCEPIPSTMPISEVVALKLLQDITVLYTSDDCYWAVWVQFEAVIRANPSCQT